MIIANDSFRYSLVFLVAQREALLSVRSKSVSIVFAVVALGAIALVGFSSKQVVNSGKDFNPHDVSVVVGLFMLVALSMSIMMSSPLLGASMVDEKDNKVVEILLSSIRADELYLGKVFGHVIIGLFQLTALWGITAVSSILFGLSDFASFPWSRTFIVLLFMFPGYLVFTALFGIAGAIVSRNEDYLAAQLPILILFFITLFIPFFPLIKIGSFESGWLPAVSWIPPLSMVATPVREIYIGEPNWVVVISWILLLALSAFLFFLGALTFKKNILK